MWQVARLGMPAAAGGCADGALEDGFVEVVAAGSPVAAVEVGAGGGEDPLPGPFAWRRRVLAGEGVGELDAAARLGGRSRSCWARTAVEVLAKRRDQGGGQDGHAVLSAFAVADHDFAALEVHVLDSEVQRLEQAKTACRKADLRRCH